MKQKSVTIGSPIFAGGSGANCESDSLAMIRRENLRLKYALLEIKLENDLKRIARAIGGHLPRIHQWPRATNGSLEIPSLASLKWNVAALRFQLALCESAHWRHKAGYNPDQPRVPSGQTGGGQWTEGSASGGDSNLDAPEDDRAPLRITIYVPIRSDDSGDDNGATTAGSPLGDPPEIPEEGSLTTQALNGFAKEAAIWLAKAALREVANPAVGTFVNAVEAAYWIYKAVPYIQSYLDPAKTLDELQRVVSNSAKGYDTHHIVEQTPARMAGYPRQMIDAPENLVRIPTLKHWEINGWYSQPNRDFGELSPRQYLRDKDWAERVRVGRMALIRFKVLVP